MNDMQLLELAAKAAGRKWHWESGVFVLEDAGPTECSAWNPLTDDGDALRLAVALQLDIVFMNGDTLVLNVCEGGGDPFQRTRNAIVRAAAEIGKGMP